MKKISILITASLFLAGCSLPLPSTAPEASLTPSPTAITASPVVSGNPAANCLPSDLQATIATDPGAGNIYATFMIKNNSTKNCQIVGDNFVTPDYDLNAIANISVTHTGTPEAKTFELKPNQIVYSQAHYANGPQCSEESQTADVTFTYAISPAQTVTFVDSGKVSIQKLTVCTSPAEITEIQIWNLSAQPITPQ